MRILRLISPVLLMFGAWVPAMSASDAADLPHVHVQFLAETTGVSAPGTLHAGLYFKLEPGWHVYWMNPGDAGEPPRIDWTLPKGVTAGAMQYPAPKRLPLGPLMDFGYEGDVLFPFPLNVDASAAPGSVIHMPAKVTWLVCRESCIPEKTNLELDVPVVSGTPSTNGAVAPLFRRFTVALPVALPKALKSGFTATPSGVRLTMETGQRETEATFFPADPGILDGAAQQKLTPTAKGLVLDLKKDASLTAAPVQLRGVIELSGGRNYALVALPGAAKPGTGSPIEPVASASVPAASQLDSQSTPRHNPGAAPASPAVSLGLARAAALAFLGGVLLNLMPCVFPVLFIKGLALVRSGGEERHILRAHGFVYATGILVSFWVLVGALLGLRAAGSILGWGFQFQSPVFLSLMAELLFFLGLSLAGQFEIGLSLTSTGGALAAKQGYAGSFFTGVLAVIVATPCTAPFMGAAVGYALAQSAVVTLAIFTALALGLAAPYVALTLQPAWTRALPKPGVWMEILKQATAVPIFGTVIWLAWVLTQAYGAGSLAALLAGLLLLAIAGWFLGRWPAQRWATAIAILLVAGVVAIGVAAPAKLAAAPASATAVGTHGGWEPWSAEAVSRYQAQGRPVFVDFTASWCLSCQVNERVALSQPEVQQAFTDAHVALLRGDWTQRDDAITQTLSQLGRSGVPTYVLYVPGETSPRLLPEVLTPAVVTDALAKLPKF